MANEIQTGSLVKLKSGGPKITVEALSDTRGSRWVRCSWFDDTRECRRRLPPGCPQEKHHSGFFAISAAQRALTYHEFNSESWRGLSG